MKVRTTRGIVFVQGKEEPKNNEYIVRNLNENIKILFETYSKKLLLPEHHFRDFLDKIYKWNGLDDNKF